MSNRKISFQNEKKTIFFLFVIGIVLYCIISMFYKSIFIMPDELFYLEAARAIAHGRGMVYNNTLSSFQKILYSIVISPAFLIDNHSIQMLLVSLINAICTASSIFPSYFLAKEAGLVKQKRYALCIFTLIFPEILNCMGFVSEVLFYPLWLWVLYLVYRSIKNDSVKMWESILLGILAYLLYMTKEVGVIALPMYFAIEVLYCYKKKSSGRRIIQCIVACVSFALCFVIAKLLLFNQTTGGSYVISTDSFASQEWTIPFYMYSVIYYAVYVILSLFIFPVFFPPKKDSRDRQFYYYVCGCVFSLIMVITYMITINEDYMSASPRLHLRYLAPLTVPFIMFFLLDDRWNVRDANGKPSINIKLLIGYAILLGIIPVINTHGLMDSKGLEIFRFMGIAPERIFDGKVASVLYFIVLKCTCLFLVIFGVYVLLKKNNMFKRVFAFAVVAICISSAIIKIYEIRTLYSVAKEDRKQAIDADEMLDTLEGRKLWVLREITDPTARLAITYHDNDQSDFTYVGNSVNSEIELMAGGARSKAVIKDYSYISLDKQLIEQNEEFLNRYAKEVVWSSELFEIRRVNYE